MARNNNKIVVAEEEEEENVEETYPSGNNFRLLWLRGGRGCVIGVKFQRLLLVYKSLPGECCRCTHTMQLPNK